MAPAAIATPMMQATASNPPHAHHHHLHHNIPIHHRGSNPLIKLVDRLRSGSDATSPDISTTPSSYSSVHINNDKVLPRSRTLPVSSSSSPETERPRLRTPSFKLLHQPRHKSSRSFSPDSFANSLTSSSSSTTSFKGRRARAHSIDASSSSRSSSLRSRRGRSAASREAALSLELWNEAYDSLRDNPRSAGLVVAYEGIIAQELPSRLRMRLGGLNSTFRDVSDVDRLDLVAAIADGGLARGPSSKGSQVGDDARAIVAATKETVEAARHAYPSAALAWCGLCTLTPLLLEAVLRRGKMRAGLLHVAGRIPWYMALPRLLHRDAWRDDKSFRSAQARGEPRELLTKLYRKVLEFEMGSVCAAASSWNTAAKNVVDWRGLVELVDTIEELDAELRTLVEEQAADASRVRLLSEFSDLDLDVVKEPSEEDDDEHVPLGRKRTVT